MRTRGDQLGRYLILDAVGAEAWVAYDPELERRVVVRLLPADTAPSHLGPATRISHPNLAAVFDVGVDGDRPYVALEHAQGATLPEWLRARPRGWRELVAVFLAAGSGLAAAHRAGVVHGAFGAERVLVGDDGRVRVTDLGLRGGTAAGDVRAFTQALSAALAPLPRAPGRLARAVRAAALDANLETLLVALARDPGRTLRRALLAVVGVGLIAGLSFAALRDDPEAACRGAHARLAGIWDASRKLAVGAAFVATGHPAAAEAWRATEAILDGYARTWLAQVEQACREARSAHTLGEEAYDLRQDCLLQRTQDLGALTRVFLRADARIVAGAEAAARTLPDLRTCADDATLKARREPACALGLAAGRTCQARVETIKVGALAPGLTWMGALGSGDALLGYDRATGEAVVLVAAADGTLRAGPRRAWRPGFTHLVTAEVGGASRAVAYDAASGDVSVVALEGGELRALAAARWAPGLSALIARGPRLLAYDGTTGAARWYALGKDGRLEALAQVSLAPGLTQLVPYEEEGAGHLFTYDVASGGVHLYRLEEGGAVTVLDEQTWSPGWTHFVLLEAGAPNLLGYKAGEGRWDVDRIGFQGRLLSRRPPGFTSVTAFGPRGRPHVVAYRADTGAYLVDRFDL